MDFLWLRGTAWRPPSPSPGHGGYSVEASMEPDFSNSSNTI